MILRGDIVGNAAIFKITPNGTLTIFASRVSYASSLAVDKTGNLFVADYDNGIIYEYKPDGSRATFASGFTTLWVWHWTARATCFWPITTSATSIRVASTNTNQTGRV